MDKITKEEFVTAVESIENKVDWAFKKPLGSWQPPLIGVEKSLLRKRKLKKFVNLLAYSENQEMQDCLIEEIKNLGYDVITSDNERNLIAIQAPEEKPDWLKKEIQELKRKYDKPPSSPQE